MRAPRDPHAATPAGEDGPDRPRARWVDTAHDVEPPAPEPDPGPEPLVEDDDTPNPPEASGSARKPLEAPLSDSASGDDRETAGDASADAHGTFAVRVGMTWRTAWRGMAFGILMLASAGFVAGGLMRGGSGVGSLVFILLGAVGLAAFGGGFLAAVGEPLARRPVLEVTAEGVRRPARWPLPRSRDRVLPWTDVTALAALRRGVAGTKRGEQDYLVLLGTDALVELARTAERPALIAFTLADVPATTPGMPEATRWCFGVEPGWDTTLPTLVKEIRRHKKVPVVDRRTR